MLAAVLPGTFASTQAQAQPRGSRTYFNQDIFVAQGQQIHNAVCLFCSVQVEGDLTGRVFVLFGSLNVTGRVEGGATVIGGNAVIDSLARLGGNAVVIGGNAVYESDESISGNAYVIGGHLSTLGERGHSTRRISFSPVFFLSVAVAVVVLLSLLVFPRRRARTTIPASKSPGSLRGF
jgi:hypothetical protein